MASEQVNRLDDKTEMYELTKKQKAVVNALAEYPDEGPTRIAELASESLDGDSVSRSYVTPITQKYGDLIDKQREIKQNERYEGTEQTSGDPLASLNNELDQDGGWQLINDRPVTGDTNGTGEESNDDESPTAHKPTTQTVAQALESREEEDATDGEDSTEEQRSDQQTLTDEPRTSDPKNGVRVQVYCPDLELLGGRVVLSEFTTAMEFRL